MNLLVCNASPRGKKSNSTYLMNSLLEGFREGGGAEVDTVYLRSESALQENLRKVAEAKAVLFVFPLYADSMTSILLRFLQEARRSGLDFSGTRVFFLIHSGFPEAVHSRSVEKILEAMSQRLGMTSGGVLVKGGSEGMQIQPAFFTAKSRKILRSLGFHMAKTGELDPDLKRKLAGREFLSGWIRLLLRFFFRNRHPYWDMMLKKNGAYERRFARPAL